MVMEPGASPIIFSRQLIRKNEWIFICLFLKGWLFEKFLYRFKTTFIFFIKGEWRQMFNKFMPFNQNTVELGRTWVEKNLVAQKFLLVIGPPFRVFRRIEQKLTTLFIFSTKYWYFIHEKFRRKFQSNKKTREDNIIANKCSYWNANKVKTK